MHQSIDCTTTWSFSVEEAYDMMKKANENPLHKIARDELGYIVEEAKSYNEDPDDIVIFVVDNGEVYSSDASLFESEANWLVAFLQDQAATLIGC